MIDINLIVEKPDYVKKKLKKRNWDFNPDEIIFLYQERKKIIKIVETNNFKKNKLSFLASQHKNDKEKIKEISILVNKINDENEINNKKLKEINKKINDSLMELPNLPDDDLLPGGKENNLVIETYGDKPKFDFKISDHVEIAKKLKLIDYNRATKISGSGTSIYTGDGAELEWALINFFISEHIKNGYKFILPPHIFNESSGFGSGQFPKFYDSVFKLEKSNKFLIPTSETILANFYSNEILKEKDLPKKFFAYTPCYRQEAGSYRTEERGIIRSYQFNKVEIFQFTTKDKSDCAFDEMVKIVVSLMKKLGLHFRLVKLAAADCSHSMARTYDVEVYFPSMDIYKEVSSISNARDYQARRNNTKYRDCNEKITFCHTLNASGLATSRVFPAILEQFQQKDGSVVIPKILQSFINKKSILKNES